MKRNSRIYITAAAVLLLLTMAACNKTGEKNNTGENGKINVVTTIFAPYDFVRQIAGDAVNVTMLLPPGAESHSFEPSPRDIITVQNSDVFIYIGGETDNWVARILDSVNNDNMNIISMMETVEIVEEEIVEGMEEEHEEEGADEHGEEGPEYDEHVWTSPRNAAVIVQAITDTLCEADASGAETYRKNAAAYIEELNRLDADFSEITANAARKTVIFGDRFPFRYFVDAYGLDYFAAFPGCSTETEPSAATVAFLVNKIRDENIPVVFHIELSNERMADTISGETGAEKLLFHACHNITKNDFESGLSYLDLMRGNMENLRIALR